MRRLVVGSCLGVAMLMVAGCGENLIQLKGIVNLDGSPVENATVTFSTEDGKNAYVGLSDAGGNFTLSYGSKSGLPAGTYKVTVVKTPKLAGVSQEGMNPGSPDYAKFMQKEMKETGGASKMPMSGPGGKAGMMMPGGGGPTKESAPKTDLPAIYSALKTSPLSFKVPADTNPLVIDLKSK